MRVTLINPPIDSVLEHGHVSPVTAHLFYNSAPLGLLYVAAALEQAGHAVTVIDAAAEGLTVEGTARRVEGTRPELVATGSTTVVFETTRRLATALKRALPGVMLVLGGYHVTRSPREAMAHPDFDVGVVGEAEATMSELCDALLGRRPLDGVAGLVLRDGDALRFIAARALQRPLDRLPFPARYLLAPDLYRPLVNDQRGTPRFTMITSRGCPHACVFCQEAGSGYRTHGPEAIADEVEHLARDFGARDIAFVDNLFCVSRRRVAAICDELLRRGLQDVVSWTCTARVDAVDAALLRHMRQAGCWRVRFGLESGSDRVLDFVSKGITRDQIRAAVTAADEAGLRPKAFFMVGHLPDTPESIEETIAFATSLPLHDITVQINTILPHTPQMETWLREGARWGRIVQAATDQASGWQPTFVPWGMEAADLVVWHRRFYRDFYLRPEVLARHLSHVRSAADVEKYVRASALAAFLFYDRERADLAAVGRALRDVTARVGRGFGRSARAPTPTPPPAAPPRAGPSP